MGITYELYLKKHFIENKIPFDYQLKIDGKKKPDFIMPSKAYYERADRKNDDVVLLSVKSSVKERWAQILNEGNRIDSRYLSTLDKTVTADAVTEMDQKNVILVVTELAKKSTESYKNASNVIPLKSFTDFVLKKNKKLWIKST